MKKILAFCAMAILGISSYAVPAKPTPVKVLQPDGTSITIQIRGDERHHFLLTEDNYLAIQKEGAYYYANVDDDGHTVSSNLLIKPKELRSAADKAYLNTVDMPQVMQKLSQASQSQAARRGPQRSQASNPDHIGLFPGTHFPAMGDQKGLVVLVRYTDKDFTLSDPYDYFYRMLNESGFSDYGGTGSAKDYFTQNSKNQFRPQFDVFGPITLSHNMSYYGGNDWWGNDQNPEQMAIEACQQLDDEIDFTEYDRDGDGYIDNIFIFYAGRGEASGGSDDTVWPHSWDVSSATSTPYYFDGVRLDRYACSNEWESGRPDGVGTFIHEFSHVMGIPDLYATSYTGAFTPGAWSAMDYGPYNNDGMTPPNYSIYERYSLNWLQPEIIDGPFNGRLTKIDQSNAGYIIQTSKDTEFFLFENRQQTGWDAYIPGHGMLVWHIDYNSSVWNSNTVNNTSSHQYVDLEEANHSTSEYNREGNPFPGSSNKTSFTDDTTPNMKTWSGQKLNLPITDIAETNGVITFKVAGGRPLVGDVTALEATDITSGGFIAHWEEAENATGYLLSVYTKDENNTDPNKSNVTYVPGYSRKDVGDVLGFAVDGLEPATKYYYKVAAYEEYSTSEPSNEITVITGDPTFDYFTPVATEATEVENDHFTANWEALEGATSYFITVNKLTLESTDFDTVDFTGGIKNLPAGWITTSKLTYANEAYAGEAVPSLRLVNSDAYISSPKYNNDVLSLKFWHRGSNAAEENKIVLYAVVSGTYQKVASFDICNAAGGQTIEFAEFPANTRGLRIQYEATGSGSLAIDDIVVEWNPQYAAYPVEGLEGHEVGDVLSMVVEGLENSTLYKYSVYATDGELTSRVSNAVIVETLAQAGINVVSTNKENIWVSGRTVRAESEVEVYTLDGRRVANSNLAPGLYLARTRTSTAKVLVK